nr:TPA: hypothetical protein PAB0014 [Pyrococcus abyssi GE5]
MKLLKVVLMTTLILAVISAGCIGSNSTQTTTTLTPEDIYEKIENQTQFAGIWHINFSVNGSIVSRMDAYSYVTPEEIKVVRHSKGRIENEEWESISYINWSSRYNVGELNMLMRIGNTSQPFRDAQFMNFTLAKKLAYPIGEIYLAFSPNFNFTKSKHFTTCNGNSCRIRVVREDSKIPLMDQQGGMYTIEYVEANATLKDDKVKEIKIYVRTSRGEEEFMECKFLHPGESWDDIIKKIEEESRIFENQTQAILR